MLLQMKVLLQTHDDLYCFKGDIVFFLCRNSLPEDAKKLDKQRFSLLAAALEETEFKGEVG